MSVGSRGEADFEGLTGFTYLKSIDTPSVASAVGLTTVGVAVRKYIVRRVREGNLGALTSLDGTKSRGDDSEEREAHVATVSRREKLK